MSIRIRVALLLIVAMWQLMQQVDATKKLCGEALNEALDLICVHGFSHRIKRDSNSPEQALLAKWRLLALRQQLDNPMEQHEPNEDDNDDNEVGSERELRRPRRRVTHQCCLQGCTYDDIREYCA